MRIVIETIPHSAQRYPTVGDYWRDEEGTFQVRVSKMGVPDFEFLVALHELVEMWLCHSGHVPFDAIDEFDKGWESTEGYLEPGDDPEAPYWYEHQMACAFERFAAALLYVNWRAYEQTVDDL